MLKRLPGAAQLLRRLPRDESGAVMVIAALLFTVLLLFTGLALDFGRAHLLRAQVQTAVDAAALAGALQVVQMVSLEVERWEEYEDSCTDPISGTPYLCYRYRSVSPARATGTHRDLIRRDGWRGAVADQCRGDYRCDDDYTVVREWLILPEGTERIARETFYQNANWSGGSGGAVVEGLNITVDQHKVEVTAAARLRTPTSFLKLAGISHLEIGRTGSAVPVRR